MLARIDGVDAVARPLPFELVGLDLPVVQTGEKGDSGVVAVLARIQAVDPALFQTIDAARLTEGGDVVLELGRHRVLLASDAGPEVIQSVVLSREIWRRKRAPMPSSMPGMRDRSSCVAGAGAPRVAGVRGAPDVRSKTRGRPRPW